MKDTNTKTSFLKTDAFVMICMYFAVLLIHVLMSVCVTIFNLTPDEYSVTAIAAYLNGYDWSSTVSTGGYYGYFQGLFYTPVFLLTDDPYIQYKLMIGINSVFMSFAPVIIYYLSRRVFDIGKAPAILFSAICGLYPCYMLLTKYTWNETLCNIMPWVFLLIMYKAMECNSAVKKQILSVLGGLTLVAGYATHGRMLALLAGGIVTVLLVFFLMKKKIFAFTGFFASIAVGFVGDTLLKDFFQDKLWLVNQLDKTPTNTIEKMLSRIFEMDGETIANFFRALIGHFFYFISSTWGFGAICVILIISAIVMYFKRNAQIKKTPEKELTAYIADNEAILSIFAFLVMGAVFVVSVAFKATSTVLDERMDTLIYGRYTEVFYPIAIYTAFLLIYRCKLTTAHTFGALAFAAVINILTNLFVAPKVVAGERMVSAMIMGIAPMRYGEAIKDLPTDQTFLKLIITNMSMLFIFVIIQLILKDRSKLYRFFCFPLAALLLYTNIYGYTNYTVPQAKNAAVGARYMDEALSMMDGAADSVVCYAIAKERYVKAQFLYPELEFILASNLSAINKLEERPHFIVADREDNLQLWAEDVYLVGSINNNTHLYACTAEACEWAVAHGYELSDNGEAYYSGAVIPATSAVTRDGDAAVMPDNSAVYTNYFTVFRGGKYYFTCMGDNIDDEDITITLTSEKGSVELHPSDVKRSEGMLVIELTTEEKLANVRLKLSNNTDEEVRLDSMTISRAEGSAAYSVAKGVEYNKPIV
ncbi:MAG: hypothetical protein IJZ47_05465 [Oscillospiraceae bacterium]|nr:hypothetical protein [Oscillospiraceae bacterium]